MTPFAAAFLDRCERQGLSMQQTKEAVDRLGTQFGRQAFDELTSGYAEKEAVYGALGRAAIGAWNNVARPAARMFGKGLGATGTAIDKTNQVARSGAKAVGDASVAGTGGYFKGLGGYGQGGNLQGTKLFDSTTVKPLMSRATMQQQIAGGATKDQLAQTHQLPGVLDRVPGMGYVRSGIDYLDRSRLTHPFVQSAKTVKNMLSTPITRPITKPIERSLLESGAANVAQGGGRAILGRMQQAGGYGLKGVDKTLGGATQLAGLATVGTGGYGLYNQAVNSPADNLQRLVKTVNPNAGPNPEVDATRADPLSAYYDAFTDKSDIADAARATSQRGLPYKIQNAAHKSLQDAKNDPVQNALANVSRFTLGGHLTQGATQAIADPTPPPVEKFFAEEVGKRAPEILANPAANFNSPTGQRLFRAGQPLVGDPTSYIQIPGRVADTVNTQLNGDGINKGGSDMTPFASAFFSRCHQSGLDLARIKTAVDFVGTRFGAQAHAELAEGFKKLAFLESFDQMVGGKQEKPKIAPTAPSPGTLPTGKNQVGRKTQVEQVTHPQGMGQVSVKKDTGASSLAPPPMSVTGPKTSLATSEAANDQAAGSAQQLAAQYAPSGWTMMGGQQMAQGLGSMFGKTAFEKTAAMPGKETLVGGWNTLKGVFRPGVGSRVAQPAATAGTAAVKAAPSTVARTASSYAAHPIKSTATMALGGLQGNMTGNAAGPEWSGFRVGGNGVDPATGEETGFRINPLGIAVGMGMGNKGFRNSGTGQTLWRPFVQGSTGMWTGRAGDEIAGHAGINTDGAGARWGARAGIMTGLGGNMAATQRDAYRAAARTGTHQNITGSGTSLINGVQVPTGYNPGQVTNLAERAKNMAEVKPNAFLQGGSDMFKNMASGAADPWRRMGHSLWGKGAYTPSASAASAYAAGGASKIGRRIGQAALPATLGLGAAGAGYSALTSGLKNTAKETMTEMYPDLREQVTGDLDQWGHERGFLNDEGQFDPVQMATRGLKQRGGDLFHRAAGGTADMTHQLLNSMGFNPATMTPEQQAAAMAQSGVNPSNGRSLVDAWRQLTGGTGNPVNTPGARNELQHQNEAARKATGQGWF